MSIIFIVIMLLIIAIVSMAETALVSCSLADAYSKYGGQRKIARLVKLKRNMAQIIAVLLIYDIFFSTICSNLIIDIVSSRIGDSWKIYINSAVAVFFVAYEIFLKAYAIHDAERLMLLLSDIIEVISIPIKPVAILLDSIAQKLIKLFLKKESASTEEKTSLQEVKHAVDFHHSIFPSEETSMLKNVLHMNTTTLDEIMVHRKDFCEIQIKKVDEIKNTVMNSERSELVVWDDNYKNVLGTIKCADILDVLYRNYNASEKELLFLIRGRIRKPKFIIESSTIGVLLGSFRDNGTGIRIVLNEYGGIKGLVGPQDVLSSIVGNIDSDNKLNITKHDKGYIVYGDTSIRELNRVASWDFKTEYINASGIALAAAKQVPKEGSEYEIDGFKIKILRVTLHVVIFLYIEKIISIK